MVTAPSAGRAAGEAGEPGDYACAQAWAALTAAHAQIAGQLAGALVRHCGLSINDFEILLRLDRASADPASTEEHGDTLRLGELQSAVPLTQPALSRAVARMAGLGWLARSAVPGDGRGVLIAITAAGREVLRQAIPVHARTIRSALLDRLSETEQAALADVLRRVVAG
jgi:DNA-binding MarR family transcriptional regulator